MRLCLKPTNDIWIILFQLFSDGGRDLPAARGVLIEHPNAVKDESHRLQIRHFWGLSLQLKTNLAYDEHPNTDKGEWIKKHWLQPDWRQLTGCGWLDSPHYIFVNIFFGRLQAFCWTFWDRKTFFGDKNDKTHLTSRVLRVRRRAAALFLVCEAHHSHKGGF